MQQRSPAGFELGDVACALTIWLPTWHSIQLDFSTITISVSPCSLSSHWIQTRRLRLSATSWWSKLMTCRKKSPASAICYSRSTHTHIHTYILYRFCCTLGYFCYLFKPTSHYVFRHCGEIEASKLLLHFIVYLCPKFAD